MISAKSATDRHGYKIYVGSFITYRSNPPVRVMRIYRQGADGTILETYSAPDPDFPRHFSCRASDTEVIR